MEFTKLRLNGLEIVDLLIKYAKPSDKYILKNADGLGPPEIDISIIDTLNAGGYYQGRRTHTREIVILIGLNPDFGVQQTAADLRQSLYGLLTPGAIDNVKIELMDEEESVAYATGYVKKMEIVPFSQTPEVQLTFACLEQYWTTSTALYVDPGPVDSPHISNIGTAPAGFHMEVIFSAPVTKWTLIDSVGNKMQIDYSFAAGDKLIIDTRPGFRGIWKEVGGVRTSVIYALSVDSIWFLLHGGENLFTTGSPQNFAWDDVFYIPQYWGI